MINKFISLLKKESQSDPIHFDESEHALFAATLMIEVARADANTEEDELEEIVNIVQKKFKLNKQECQDILASAHQKADHTVSLTELTQSLNTHLNDQQKKNIIELLWKVARADGNIDHHEEYLIKKVANLLYINPSKVMHAKHKSKD